MTASPIASKSVRGWLRTFVYGLAWIFVLCIVMQVLLAGLALFMEPTHWSRHVDFARIFAILPLAMTVLAYCARLERRLVWRCVGLTAMMIFMFFTAAISARVSFLGAMHPVIALFLFWSGVKLIQSLSHSRSITNGK